MLKLPNICLATKLNARKVLIYSKDTQYGSSVKTMKTRWPLVDNFDAVITTDLKTALSPFMQKDKFIIIVTTDCLHCLATHLLMLLLEVQEQEVRLKGSSKSHCPVGTVVSPELSAFIKDGVDFEILLREVFLLRRKDSTCQSGSNILDIYIYIFFISNNIIIINLIPVIEVKHAGVLQLCITLPSRVPKQKMYISNISRGIF